MADVYRCPKCSFTKQMCELILDNAVAPENILRGCHMGIDLFPAKGGYYGTKWPITLFPIHLIRPNPGRFCKTCPPKIRPVYFSLAVPV